MSIVSPMKSASEICQRVSIYSVSYFSSTATSKMPAKKQKKTEKGMSLAAADTGTSKGDSEGAVVANSNSTVAIKVLAKPGAKFNSITGIGEERVGIQIAAPPVDGEANTVLVKYLSKVLGVRKTDVSLDKGSRSRQKVVVVSGMDRQSVLDKLGSQVDNG
ncbi:UPF0235 protein C15orf40 homolog [Ylistrum balloti]|uniref:UPF0235 protein C15orf40 homolog n=1 Tax=Ylistrum balloti TaxID=509963 RepID=UPI00290582E0|nr:UPF0235 protein C15orf40 homolog [Ylistrum balloti]